jgi:hypothetical protein
MLMLSFPGFSSSVNKSPFALGDALGSLNPNKIAPTWLSEFFVVAYWKTHLQETWVLEMRATRPGTRE